ncbi:MAG: hypothetical protein ABI565_03540 [Vicinamibacteria bacterium]
MKSISRFGLLSLAVAVTVACGQAQPPAKTAPAAAPAAQSAPAAAPASGASFGVPECDDYMTRYVACVDSKVPEAARAAMRQGLEQTKAQWTQAASTPEGKDGLAMACRQMTETSKSAMAPYGCSF